MLARNRRVWIAIGLFVCSVLLNGHAPPVLWLAATAVLMLDEIRPSWYRPPTWLQRPYLGVLASAAYVLSSAFFATWSLGNALAVAATVVLVWDSHERGDLRAVPAMVRSIGTMPSPGPDSDAHNPSVMAAVRKRAVVGLGICLASLFLTWVPYETRGFVTWERTGTEYVDGAGRVVDDRTWYSPEWKDQSQHQETGLQLGQGFVSFVSVASLLWIFMSARFERSRARRYGLYAGPPVLLLWTYANGYAADGIGWWVYVAGLAVFSTACWQMHRHAQPAAVQLS